MSARTPNNAISTATTPDTDAGKFGQRSRSAFTARRSCQFARINPDQSNDDHNEANRTGAEHRSCFTLLLAQVLKKLCNNESERNQRERRSHPGNAGTFVRKKCALKGELHSGVRLCGRFLLNGFVIHNRFFAGGLLNRTVPAVP